MNKLPKQTETSLSILPIFFLLSKLEDWKFWQGTKTMKLPLRDSNSFACWSNCRICGWFMRVIYALGAFTTFYLAMRNKKNVTRILHSFVKYLRRLSLLFVGGVITRQSPRSSQLMPKCIIWPAGIKVAYWITNCLFITDHRTTPNDVLCIFYRSRLRLNVRHLL